MTRLPAVTQAILAGLSYIGAELVAYWTTAPTALRIAALWLTPLMLTDGFTAIWMGRIVARKADLEPAQRKLIKPFDRGDHWQKATARFGMTMGLIILAGAVDHITGTRHMTVLWILLWACSGHVSFALRRLQVIARINDFDLPIFPTDSLERLADARDDDDEDDDHAT